MPDVDRDAWIGYRLEATATLKEGDVVALDVNAEWRGLWEQDSVNGPLRASKSRRARLAATVDVAPGDALILATRKRIETKAGPSIFVLILKPHVIHEAHSGDSTTTVRGA